jgi:hypothetical protein
MKRQYLYILTLVFSAINPLWDSAPLPKICAIFSNRQSYLSLKFGWLLLHKYRGEFFSENIQ